MPPPINDSVQAPLYKDYHNDNTYQLNKGRLVVPCCNGDPVVIQVHKQFSVRTQTWSAVKDRTPPVVPAPESESDSLSNVIVIAQTITMPLPVPTGESANSYRFAVAGTYQYLETVPTTDRTGVPSGRAPWFGAGISLGLGALVGGAGMVTAPFGQIINFDNGQYGWPYTCIGPQFFDSTLSTGRPVVGDYLLDVYARG